MSMYFLYKVGYTEPGIIPKVPMGVSYRRPKQADQHRDYYVEYMRKEELDEVMR